MVKVEFLKSPSCSIKNGLTICLSRNALSKKSSFILKSALTCENRIIVVGADMRIWFVEIWYS
ncbi:hypothetical protein D3C71_1969260 [compost metagenome]